MAPLGRQAPDQPVRVCCHDARRLGLHLPRHRRLPGSGVQPGQIVAPLYESYWLSAAVEPTPGEACWWEVPNLAADCGSSCLRPWGQSSPQGLHSVLLDQAPAQVAQRVEGPEHVVLVGLPA
jgi:hypothetical protein